MNEWLKRRSEAKKVLSPYPVVRADEIITKTGDIRELKEGMRVTIWVNAAHGRHHIIDALPFEEVITHHFVDETVVNGFSLWIDGREILWQRLGWFRTGVTVPRDGSLRIDMTFFKMELSPFALS